MHDEEKSEAGTDADHDVSILIVRMGFVVELDGVLVEEHRSGFLKRNAVVELVALVLRVIPFERAEMHIL